MIRHTLVHKIQRCVHNNRIIFALFVVCSTQALKRQTHPWRSAPIIVECVASVYLLVYQITLFLTLLITVMLKVNLVGEFINTPMLDTCLLVVRSAMPSRHDSLTFTRNPPEAVTAC